MLPTSKWNHFVEYEGKYYRINTNATSNSVNPCKEVPLPELYPGIDRSAMKVTMNSMYGSNPTIAAATTIVDHLPILTKSSQGGALYPQTLDEACQKSESKLKALKQQKPIILKTKNQKSWK